MISFDEQKKLFELIGKTLGREIECFVVGGSAMIFYNFSKTVTRDVDIVFFSDEDRISFIKSLEDIGFTRHFHGKLEGEPISLKLKDTIFDLFSGKLFRLVISKGMVSRVRERIEFGNLTILIASPEDIILSKSMTDRMGDRQDVSSLIREMNVNWNTIIDECLWQSKNNPKVAFGVYLYDFLEDLVHDWKADIPREIIKKITKIYEESIEEAGKK